MYFSNKYDVIIIGGGHAGIEAASASARMGSYTLLITQSLDRLGQLSCNPAIGGIGKSQLVKEIDALGGLMALASDYSGIHFHILNSSKGPAVRSTRIQVDRNLYRRSIYKLLQKQDNLNFLQEEVVELIIDQNYVVGVITSMGISIYARSIVLTVGTFLRGKIHIGIRQYFSGRFGDHSSIMLANYLRKLSFPVGRLKTGTPPRIDGRSIDYSKMKKQLGQDPVIPFSYLGYLVDRPSQIPCYITYTTTQTHDIIRENLHLSSVYSGNVKGKGPRYCPSIEDKVVRFSDKLSHQIFVEPEGLYTDEIYPNGISTSLPFVTQLKFIRTIIGFEKAFITRPGYAVEYDYFDPRGLTKFLQTKIINNLFFAGQINGTTGYEEAAAQGLIAGINAALLVKEKELWCPGRNESYIGVLIDDLINCGVDEPYRMFTSRAEYRLLLREDNADLRLMDKGKELGLVDDIRWRNFCKKRDSINKVQLLLKSTLVNINHYKSLFGKVNFLKKKKCSAIELLKYSGITYSFLQSTLYDLNFPKLSSVVEDQINIYGKYFGYIERQLLDIKRFYIYENIKLPVDLDYAKISGLSTEAIQRLSEIKPATLGQAKRIFGVTSSSLFILLIYLKKIGIYK
ncbi:tRNA uridine-5-carboxymethylaminomethyl(34) synthesis enzyme MnmG [Candidatus Legionella polyplacis]|uniref:tRNA uridine 5-carboxymethylaminomethyl modification enzyme MnmG n=1 Tax=Candidatus Legionella polyplacis TaxID=2005262 RepID=A0ABZ2GV37_9GAMM